MGRNEEEIECRVYDRNVRIYKQTEGGHFTFEVLVSLNKKTR